MDADAIRAALPDGPISGGAAADRIAAALGTPNQPGEKAAVTAYVVRRFIDRGLLTELSVNVDGSGPELSQAGCGTSPSRPASTGPPSRTAMTSAVTAAQTSPRGLPGPGVSRNR